MKQSKNKPVKVTTILFDFGNVLVVDTEKAFEEAFNLSHIAEHKRGRYEAVSHRTERGEEPTEHLLKSIKETFKMPISLGAINEMMVSTALIEPMWNLLQTLRKQYQVAILSNNQKLWPEETAMHLGISLKGIPFFNSADIGVRKPLKYPFEYVMRKLKKKPEQIVFIDDKKSNVATAEKLGMKGIVFTGDLGEVGRKLKEYGVKFTIK